MRGYTHTHADGRGEPRRGNERYRESDSDHETSVDSYSPIVQSVVGRCKGSGMRGIGGVEAVLYKPPTDRTQLV
jgi:hypothetical protein